MPVKSISIETTTVCNHRCVFCPVSSERRAKQTMERATMEAILDGLNELPVEMVFLNGFNEPTHDKRLLEWVEMIHERGYKVHLNSNGSGLTPELVDALLAAQVKNININVSTIDPERFRRTRGSDDLDRVVRNLHNLLDKARVGSTHVTLMVLGHLDAAHRQDIESIEAAFAHGRPHVVICPIEHYAGSDDVAFPKDIHVKKLNGCGGKRLTDWLHFTPDGAAIMCCQDYYSKHVVGDVASSTPSQIHHGQALETLRRWVDGEEEAPADFMCRSCVMAVDVRERFCRRCTLPASMGTERSCGRCAVNEHAG